MNVSSSTTPSIAIVSFMPDFGHVLPLLRIGKQLAAAGYGIVCYLPEECRPIVGRYDFPYVSLGRCTTAEQRKLLSRVSMRSDFYMASLGPAEVWLCYWSPISAAMAPQIERVRKLIRQQNPRFLLVDPHVFDDWYRRLATDADATLIRHDASGSLFPLQRYYAILFGAQQRPEWVMRLVEYFFGNMRSLGYQLMKFRHLREYLRYRRGREQIAAAVAAIAPDYPAKSAMTLDIITGLGVLEKQYLSHRLNAEGMNWIVLAPVPQPEVGELPSALQDWFRSVEGKAVVYLGFGTMVHLDRRMAAALVRALHNMDVAALWALPTEQQGLLNGLVLPDTLRVESFVPQPAVLAHPAVRCFVTHGGGGGIQEGVMSGTPMLCIPFMWDQHYNASIVELLGAGLKLHKKAVTADHVRRIFDTLLNDPYYRERSNQLRLDLERHRAEHPVASLLESAAPD